MCGEDEEGLAMGTANRIFMVNTGCFCITEKTFSQSGNTWQIARKKLLLFPISLTPLPSVYLSHFENAFQLSLALEAFLI